ncbi:hypothetical protein CBL_06119 [Carabus blaptoides fortunei]
MATQYDNAFNGVDWRPRSRLAARIVASSIHHSQIVSLSRVLAQFASGEHAGHCGDGGGYMEVVAASTSECVDWEGNEVRGVRRARTLGEIDNSGSVQKP